MVLSSAGAKADLGAVVRHVTALAGDRAKVGALHDMVLIEVGREHLVDIARELRDDPVTHCDLYSVNAGVDLGDGQLRSVTFVRGVETRVYVMLRTPCTEQDPHVPSLVSVWEGANWPERETYDMFGIIFDGHPDLRRVFMEESFPGHPLRKSFLPPRSDARGG